MVRSVRASHRDTMNRTELATARFNQGFSCSQCICATYAPLFGAEEAIALRMAASYGGGMGHLDGLCGAVAGALIVIGLARFHETGDIRADKTRVYEVVETFVRRFKERHGSTQCTGLLGYNLSKRDELVAAVKANRFAEVCPRYLAEACRLLDELLELEP